jgi:hypothetical protein
MDSQIKTLKVFNLVKKVLSVHTKQVGNVKMLNVKEVAIKLREMMIKINCTLQGNYFSKQ